MAQNVDVQVENENESFAVLPKRPAQQRTRMKSSVRASERDLQANDDGDGSWRWTWTWATAETTTVCDNKQRDFVMRDFAMQG
jgi:hypothetical protein